MIAKRVIAALDSPKHPFSNERFAIVKALAKVVEAAERAEFALSASRDECSTPELRRDLASALSALETALDGVEI